MTKTPQDYKAESHTIFQNFMILYVAIMEAIDKNLAFYTRAVMYLRDIK